MQYKTIVLELLQEQPELYNQLQASRTLLRSLDQYALALKASHESWMDRIGQRRPGSDRSQVSGEALEFALREILDCLSTESKGDADEPPSLDAAMAFLRRHMPPA